MDGWTGPKQYATSTSLKLGGIKIPRNAMSNLQGTAIVAEIMVRRECKQCLVNLCMH